MALIGISGKIGSGKDTVGKIIQWLNHVSKLCKEDEDFQKNYEHDWGMSLYSKEAFDDFFRSDTSEFTEFIIKKFAFKLKLICSILSGRPVEDFELQEVKDSYLSDEWDIIETATTKELLNDLAWGYKSLEEAFERGWKEVPMMPGGFMRINKDGKRTYRWLLQTVGTEAMRNNIHPDVWVNALFADYTPYNQELIRKTVDMVGGNKMNIGIAGKVYPKWVITDMRFPNEAKTVKDRGGKVIRVTRGYPEWVDTATGVEPAIEHPSETALDDYTEWDYEIDNNGTIEDLIEAVRKILIIEKII